MTERTRDELDEMRRRMKAAQDKPADIAMNDQLDKVTDFEKYHAMKLIPDVLIAEAQRDPALLEHLKAIIDRQVTDPEDRALMKAQGLL